VWSFGAHALFLLYKKRVAILALLLVLGCFCTRLASLYGVSHGRGSCRFPVAVGLGLVMVALPTSSTLSLRAQPANFGRGVGPIVVVRTDDPWDSPTRVAAAAPIWLESANGNCAAIPLKSDWIHVFPRETLSSGVR
jgi:hypothetical protein